jgi:predicted nucleotidyltransferase
LDFIKEVARFSEEFDLKKASIAKKIIGDAVETILGDELSGKINKIVVYGSMVENALTLRSDIDIAVIFGRIDVADATAFRKRVLGRVPMRVDVQVYDLLPEKIKKEVDAKGKVIYKK